MNAIAEVPNGALISFIERAAKDETFDVAKFETLLRVRRDEAHDHARRVFNQAMAVCQSEMLPVLRGSPNKGVGNKYATLEAIDQQMRPIYTRHGFSVRFGSAQPPQPGWMRITCTVAHESGYFEENYLDSPVSNQGAQGGRMAMTAVQAVGSVVTYLRRYLLGMVFNIVQADVVGIDDDGEGQRGTGSGENMRSVAADITRAARITERAEDYEAPPTPAPTTSRNREPGWQDFIKALSLALNDAQDWEEVDRILCGERVMKAKAAFKDIALQELNKLIVATLQKWEPKPDDMAGDQDEVHITGEDKVMSG